MKKIPKNPGSIRRGGHAFRYFCGTCLWCSAVIVILAACAGTEAMEETPQPRVAEKSLLPHKVAILPFVNQTSNPEAAAVMRRMFYNFFSSLNYLDVEPAFVDKKLTEQNVYREITAGDAVSAQQLGQMLGADAVVFGEVLSLGKVYAVLYSDTYHPPHVQPVCRPWLYLHLCLQ